MYLDGGEVGNWGTYIIGTVNAISTNSKAHTLFFLLVGLEIRDKATIRNCFIIGDGISCDEPYCICSTNTVTDSLCQSFKII